MVATSPNAARSRRALHLVDLENLIGAPAPYHGHARATFETYLRTAFWRPGDHVIVAANPAIVDEFALDPPAPCGIYAVSGKDAADRRLIECMEPAWVASNYDTLRIGSGDGIFSGPAKGVRGAGVKVFFVARAEYCSGRLWRAAFPIVPFHPPSVPTELSS